jgi:hypothetical protein
VIDNWHSIIRPDRLLLPLIGLLSTLKNPTWRKKKKEKDLFPLVSFSLASFSPLAIPLELLEVQLACFFNRISFSNPAFGRQPHFLF